MTKHTLIKFAIATVLALGLAFWAGSVREPTQKIAADQPLVTGLAERINDVKSLRITGAGNQVIATLVRGEQGWTLTEKSGYRADLAKIREYLLTLSRSKLIEAKTAEPANYARLGVEDVAAADAKGALLEIEGLAAEPVRIIVGNFHGQAGDGTFVRRANESQSWLASGNVTVDKVAANWLDRELVDVASSRFAEVSVTHEGKTLRVFKSEVSDANFSVADVPRGREVASEFVANGMASLFAGLRFDDVKPEAEAVPGEAKIWQVRHLAFDGLVIETTAWEVGELDQARFRASLDEARFNAHVVAEQARAKSEHEAAVAAANAATPAEGEAKPAPPEAPLAVRDPAKDREQRLAALNEEIARMNARFSGWSYVIPAFKFASINKTMEDMLKPRT